MNQDQLIRAACADIKPAIEFCQSVFSLCQELDDLVDEPDIQPDILYRAVWRMMFELPENEFYRTFFDRLNPLLRAAFQDWMDSNWLQDGGTEQKAAAYVLRDTISMILIHVAELCGGYDHMREWSRVIRAYVYDEPLDKFMEEHSGHSQRS